MAKLKFDVMLNGRFICTLRYECKPPFIITDEELVAFVISKLPTLKNKPFNIAF